MADGRFAKRQFDVFPELWTPIDAFTVKWGELQDNEAAPMDGRKYQKHAVRMSVGFSDVLTQTDKRPPNAQSRDPITSLTYVFQAIIPFSRDIFAPNLRLGLHKLLGRNNYIMEAAFVAGVIGLSRFLGEKKFPPGVYSWPPPCPEFPDLAPSPSAPASSSACSASPAAVSGASSSSAKL